MPFSIMTTSITMKNTTLSINYTQHNKNDRKHYHKNMALTLNDTQHNDAQHNDAHH